MIIIIIRETEGFKVLKTRIRKVVFISFPPREDRGDLARHPASKHACALTTLSLNLQLVVDNQLD